MFRRAGIYAKPNLSSTLMHVAYPHLREANTVLRALDAIVILSTGEPFVISNLRQAYLDQIYPK